MRYRESFSARAVVRATRASHWREFQSEPPLVVATLFALYAVAFLSLLLMRPWNERTFVAVQDVMGIVPPVLAGLFALVAGQRSAGHVRLGWWLIGAACLLWGAGDVIWALPIALSPLIVALAFVAVREPSPAISVPLFAMVGIAALALVARLMINVGLGREIDAQRERLFLWIEAHRRSAQA